MRLIEFTEGDAVRHVLEQFSACLNMRMAFAVEADELEVHGGTDANVETRWLVGELARVSAERGNKKVCCLMGLEDGRKSYHKY